MLYEVITGVFGRVVIDLPALQQQGGEGRVALPAHKVLAGQTRDMGVPVEGLECPI